MCVLTLLERRESKKCVHHYCRKLLLKLFQIFRCYMYWGKKKQYLKTVVVLVTSTFMLTTLRTAALKNCYGYESRKAEHRWWKTNLQIHYNHWNARHSKSDIIAKDINNALALFAVADRLTNLTSVALNFYTLSHLIKLASVFIENQVLFVYCVCRKPIRLEWHNLMLSIMRQWRKLCNICHLPWYPIKCFQLHGIGFPSDSQQFSALRLYLTNERPHIHIKPPIVSFMVAVAQG